MDKVGERGIGGGRSDGQGHFSYKGKLEIEQICTRKDLSYNDEDQKSSMAITGPD